jgi:hypothetical protein
MYQYGNGFPKFRFTLFLQDEISGGEYGDDWLLDAVPYSLALIDRWLLPQ